MNAPSEIPWNPPKSPGYYWARFDDPESPEWQIVRVRGMYDMDGNLHEEHLCAKTFSRVGQTWYFGIGEIAEWGKKIEFPHKILDPARP